jgi:hypothetical protein
MGIEYTQKSDATIGNQQWGIDDYTGNTVEYADATTRMLATKIGSVARTDTSAKNLFVLPIGAVPVAVYMFWGTASNAGTTATVSVGITGTNTYFINGQDVKGTSGQVRTAAATNLFAAQSTSATTQVVGIYAETGTASSTGGPFYIAIDFYVP